MMTNGPSKSNALPEAVNSGVIPNCADLEISRAGYELWRAAGRPAGRYMEFLAEAEREYRKAARKSARLEQ